MTRETTGVDTRLQQYIAAHSDELDDVQESLIGTTAALGDAAGMQIGRNQVAFLTVLVGALQPRFALEVGTFTGLSSLTIARSLPTGGRLLCCDISEEWTSVAREHWEMAGVADRIELRIAPALDTLAALPSDQRVDFAFIDADKTGYLSYYEAIVARLAPHGVIAVDNTLWSGSVVDDSDQSEDTVAIRAFNAHVAADERTHTSLTPVGDGVTLIRLR